MTLQEINKIAKQWAESDIERLTDIKESIIENTKFGSITGHYAGNAFFFYAQGRELFRDSDKNKAIKFLQNSYNINVL
tara:strand:+ start:519 stop:752 length:234 start_codon:yes stop_codon:yes gene_type:complete